MEKICCFFGHRDIFYDLQDELKQAIDYAVEKFGITTFYVGGRGQFDKQAEKAVRIAKKKYPQIKLVLVLPYFSNDLNKNKSTYENIYDSIYIPQELIGQHFKGAIVKRNRIMVTESELVICHIYKEYGGAYSSVKFAQKQGKNIIEIKNG